MKRIEAVIWNNDGTIMGQKAQMVTKLKTLYFLIFKTVSLGSLPLYSICSGCKTEESEREDFDPEKDSKRIYKAGAKLRGLPRGGSRTSWGVFPYLERHSLPLKEESLAFICQRIVASFR